MPNHSLRDDLIEQLNALAERRKTTPEMLLAGWLQNANLPRATSDLQPSIASMPDFIARYDREARLLYANPAMIENASRSLQNYHGKSLRELGYTGETIDEIEITLDQVFANNEETALTYAYTVPETQRTRIYEARFIPESDSQGRVLSVLAITRDLTTQKLAEQALQESTERLELALHGGQLVMWDWDIPSNQIIYNERWQELIESDTPVTAFAAQTMNDLIHPDDFPHVETLTRLHLSGGSELYQAEFRLKTYKGNLRWVWTRGRVVERDSHGEPLRAAGTILDITDRKKAEEATQLYIERLQIINDIQQVVLFQQSPQVIAEEALHQLRLIAKCERVVLTLFDLEQMEVYLYSSSFDSTAPANRNIRIPLDTAFFEQLAKGDVLYYADLRLIESPAPPRQKQINEGFLSAAHVPLQVGGKTIGTLNLSAKRTNAFSPSLLSLAKEVSGQLALAIQHAQLYEELQSTVAELQTKNAELERFTYTVSHDLKSPLITIHSFLGFLEKDHQDGATDKLSEDIQFIRQAADRMHELLDDLLELSRVGRVTHTSEHIAMSELAEEALQLVMGQVTQNNITVIISPDMPTINGDRKRLREVFQNLIENATKFMGNQSDPHIWIGIENGTFYVQDNGIGIDQRYHERVFRLFEQLSPSENGTGIGLALIKRIIEVHGGRIWVESQGKNQGSKFWFTLPMLRE